MTRNYKASIVAASIIIFILALYGVYRLYQIKVTKPLPNPSPVPTTIGFQVSPLPAASPKPSGKQPETGPSDEFPNIGILVESPDSGSTVTSPLQINGFANVPQKRVAIVVYDVYGNALGQGMATACFAKTPCPFSASVVFARPQTQTGTVEVFSPSTRSGSKEYLQIAKVNF